MSLVRPPLCPSRATIKNKSRVKPNLHDCGRSRIATARRSSTENKTRNVVRPCRYRSVVGASCRIDDRGVSLTYRRGTCIMFALKARSLANRQTLPYVCRTILEKQQQPNRGFCVTGWSSRPVAAMSFEAEKQKFLAMPAEEKRAYYKSQVNTLDKIPTWPEYWDKNKATIPKAGHDKVEKVDKDLASRISIWEGDITSLEIDAIVNAANSSLLGGGGVDGAIHKAAGGMLKKECATLGGCRVGEAKITGGYALPAKYVIHTVGPQGEKPEKLKKCYENSLEVAKENKLRTIAFPCISTGIYGYPQRPAAIVALSTVKQFLLNNKDDVDRIIFCLFLKSDKDIYESLLQKYFALD